MLKGPQPAHLRVLDKLRSAIDSGRLAADSFMPSEREIAEELGVSRPTVRRALEELEHSGCIVRGGGRRPRVLPRASSAPRRPDNVVDPTGPPDEPRRDHVALFTCIAFSAVVQGDNSELTNIVASVIRGFEPVGVHVTYINTYGRQLDTEEQLSSLIEPFYGGIVFLPAAQPSDGALRALANAHCPSVIVSGYTEPFGERVHTVDRDDIQGGAIATRHLLEHGHRRIVHVTYDEDAHWVDRRVQGYRRALADAGGPRGRVVKPFGFAELPVEDKVRLLAERMPPNVDAVFAANDAMADVVCRWAESAARAIPGDLSVVGFDNVAVAIERSLTSVSHMSAELGRRAMEVLFEAMRPDAPRIVRRELVDPVLVVRSSVARRRARGGRGAGRKTATSRSRKGRSR